jgi:hypothetical protein
VAATIGTFSAGTSEKQLEDDIFFQIKAFSKFCVFCGHSPDFSVKDKWWHEHDLPSEK